MPSVPVLFLEPRLSVGGAERVLANIVTHLNPDHFRPIVCCLKEPGPIGEELIGRGVPVHHHLISSRYSLRVLPALVSLIQSEDIQLIHTTNQPLTTFWSVASGLLAGGPAQVTSVHSTRSTFHRGRGRWVNRIVASQIDAIVALANAHRDYLIAEEGMDRSKIHVIPNGIDLSRFSRPIRLRRSDLGIPDDAPLAGVLAVLRPEKAHDNFLRAAQLVREQVPAAHFAIIGDGAERQRLESLTRALGLEQAVHFLGRRDDVDQVLPLIDVSVLPSRDTETFPLAILESMAAGRPVVVTDVGSLRDMVTSGANGFIVAKENVASLAAAINLLLTNPVLARQMGANSLERSQRFGVDRMVRDIELLFHELLETKKLGRRLTVGSEPVVAIRHGHEARGV